MVRRAIILRFLACLVLGGTLAHAGDLLRGGASAQTSRRNPADGTAGAGDAAAAAARQNARDRLSRTNRALQSVKQMQSAARAAAAARKGNNLGRDPNFRPLPGFNGLNGPLGTTRLPRVRDGLGKGGLQLAPGVPKDLRRPNEAEGEDGSLYVGARQPKQKKTKDGVVVNIKQTDPQALLTWKTFNVGKKTRVNFNQSKGGDNASNWIAFNRILDPSGSPSQILGSISAQGQVYVINQNGIIFGGTSQVNVHTLVASALPINEGLINQGLLNNPDAQFLFSSLPQSAGSKGTPAFNPPRNLHPLKQSGDVSVQASARLTSPASPEGVGGRIMLVGANVDNAGTISTEGGQTILAAGLQVGIAAHDTDDPTLRGIDVFVGAIQKPGEIGIPYAGTAKNTGLIDAPRASVVMTGREVQQLGVIDSSTSVSFNGRIDLLANYDAVSNVAFDTALPSNGPPFLFRKTGTVTMGRGSVMRILPEYASEDRVVGTELALRSFVSIVGEAIDFQNGSSLLVPNGDVYVNAGNWQFVPSTQLPRSRFVDYGGIIRAAPNALIDVAGTPDVFVPISQSIIDVELRGPELADSPLQRDSLLRGQTITIDTRRTGVFNGKRFVGTPLGDAAGFLGLIERDVGQLTVAGGSVTLTAGDSVILERGSTIDVSGGFRQHEGGLIRTTRLVFGGQLIDIADATPDRLYDGFFSDTTTSVNEKYGIVQTFRRPLSFDGAFFESSYIEGADGGSIAIAAPAMALDGTLTGRTVTGPRQLRDVDNKSQPAETGSLSLTFQSDDLTPYLGLQTPPPVSPTPPTVVFKNEAYLAETDPFAVDFKGEPFVFSREGSPFLVEPEDNPFIETDLTQRVSLREDRQQRVILSPNLLSESNFGSLTVDNRDGDVRVPRGVAIAAPVGGSLTVLAANVGIFGSIEAPGGDLVFTVSNFSPYQATIRLSDNTSEDFFLPEIDPDRGRFILGRGARLVAAGLNVDDRFESATRRSVPVSLDGGSVSIEAFEARLRPGSLIDVSGGVLANRDAEISYGDGGSISILTGRDTELSGLVGGAGIQLDGDLRGFSGATGGSLELRAPQILVSDTGRARRGRLVVAPEFFSRGGFGSYSLTGIGFNATFELGEFGTFSLGDFVRARDPDLPEVYRPAVVIEADTVINPIATSLRAFAVRDEPIRVQRIVDRQSDRSPVSLAFSGEGAVDDFTQLLEVRADVVMRDGASIQTDPLASVSLSGDTVTVRGSITAPAGSITITGADSFPLREDIPETALTTVHLTPTARLSTRGAVVRTFDPFGDRSGFVLPGGTISVEGNINAERGSVLDVSGASGSFDLAPALVGVTPIGGDGRLIPVNSGINQPLFARRTVATRLDSDAGVISLQGGEQLFSDATLLGRPGGPTALGGTLEVSSGRFYRPDELLRLPTDINLEVTQSDPAVAPFREDAIFSPIAFLKRDQLPNRVGNPVRDGNGNILEGFGHFTVDRFAEAGFDSLTLDGVVSFVDEVRINARQQISVADGGVLFAEEDVRLRAPYVRLGTRFRPPPQPGDAELTSVYVVDGLPFFVAPTKGPGRLEVIASLIDIGNLSLQNIQRADFIAEGGDIRGNGTLNIAGRLKFRAAQIYPTTGSTFTIAAYDYPGKKPNPLDSLIPDGQPSLPLPRINVIRPSQVSFEDSGPPRFPLTAGGTLRVFGSEIDQSGTLLAPFGRITLGYDGSGDPPTDLLAGDLAPFPITQRLLLRAGSLTSVAGVDPVTGEQMLVPFGLNSNETSLVDPRGLDVTAGGLLSKSVSISGQRLAARKGSSVDIRGGGDLLSYRFVAGLGGSVDILGTAATEFSPSATYEAGDLVTFNGRTFSARNDTPDAPRSISTVLGPVNPTDFTPPVPGSNLFWTEVAESFAVVPGYEANFAPYAPFAASTSTGLLEGDPGYVSPNLRVGDRVALRGTSALAAGEYTLLPRRYALLPGAVLVTPRAGSGLGTTDLPDGSSLVSGVRFNNLNQRRRVPATFTRFQVESENVFRDRADYRVYSANSFLKTRAAELDLDSVQRLPIDSGNLLFRGVEALRLRGDVAALAPVGGRGAKIDVSTPLNILITGGGKDPAVVNLPPDFFGVGDFGDPLSGTAVLRSNLLSNWGAESLVVGGFRTDVPNGTLVNVESGTITVANEGVSLRGPEVILAANRFINVKSGSRILQTGDLTEDAQRLIFYGDGVMVRVSSDVAADSLRRSVTDAVLPQLTVARRATIRGNSLTLDSTSGTALARRANVTGRAITLNSGQITIGLRESGKLAGSRGLVLEGPARRALQGSEFLSLLSYSTIDLYGTGIFRVRGDLELHAAEIRGFNTDGGRVTIISNNLLLDNEGGATGPIRNPDAVEPELNGRLAFRTRSITLGEGDLSLLNYQGVRLTAPRRVRISDEGSLTVPGNLRIATPVVTAARSSSRTIVAGGKVELLLPNNLEIAQRGSNLGGSLTIEGKSISSLSDLILPSGLVTLRATDGDVTVDGLLDASGRQVDFFDARRFTNAGRVTLESTGGSVVLGKTSVVDVSANRRGGDAGMLSVRALDGNFEFSGELAGAGGRRGTGGSFELEVGRLPELDRIDELLNAASFDELRSYRIRQGDVTVNGEPLARNYFVVADSGSIRVNGKIDASGRTGGNIVLRAAGSVTLADAATLTVAARQFDNAGKGGAIFLEAGSQTNGTIDRSGFVVIEGGSTIDLSVKADREGSDLIGRFGGTLHLRAPQFADQSDLQVAPILGSITGASKITVEGYQLYDLTSEGPDNGSLSNALRNQIRTDGQAFAGTGGDPASPTYTAMLARLLAGNADLEPLVILQPGAEVIHRTGDLTLGTAFSTASEDWNLSGFRYGPRSAPGVLTVRAAGDINLFNAISDGFETSDYRSNLVVFNPDLPANAQSYSYRFTAGADPGAADYRSVLSLSGLQRDTVDFFGRPITAEVGSIKLGKNAGIAIASRPGAFARTDSIVPQFFQVIRTGSGDIDLSAARDIQLLNVFATVYTAGTQVEDPTMGGTFDVPELAFFGAQITLGGQQQQPPSLAQYTLGGGNVNLTAGRDIIHLTAASDLSLIADSSQELPINWLYRRGVIDPETGLYGETFLSVPTDTDVGSTSWWVDFTNFFQGIGALGGGNVTLTAGRNVSNVDAVAPTNARAPKGFPDLDAIVELGGGDILVKAGNNVDAGIYYVERGEGTLIADNEILTNQTRSPSLGNIDFFGDFLPPETWLPTTLFLGKGSFDVRARGDVLLGPVANPFLLPGGYNNSYFYKTYFSTFAPDSELRVRSLGGAVTLRQSVVQPQFGQASPQPILQTWFNNVLLFNSVQQTASFFRPWLRLNENRVDAFAGVSSLNAPSLRATSFSSDINVVGDLTLVPSPVGTLELLAGRSINALNKQGTTTIDGAVLNSFGSSRIVVSDADPSAIPGVSNPFAYQTLPTIQSSAAARVSGTDFLNFIDVRFDESGAPDQPLGQKRALHDDDILHRDDPNPLLLLADKGSISGLTLFSPKFAQIVAGQDITDISLYVQHSRPDDITFVAAGRDIIPFNSNAPLRALAQSEGNVLNALDTELAGDIQITGQGTLEVLAGRNLDLGTGANNADGTGVGITSIGNARNASLPFAGADIVAAAGIGQASSLTESRLDFEGFIAEYLSAGESGEAVAAFDLDSLLPVGVALDSLSPEEQKLAAVRAFFRILRDTGRGFADPESANFGTYDPGFAAIDTLFGTGVYAGELLARARDIRTRNGGDISILVPGGGLTLASTTLGSTLTPPGIITEASGDVSIFTDDDVDVGIGRIFTLRGGNQIIWSSSGDIAAGSAAKTVQSAPPTRVLLDPSSARVQTDLAGLATGGGIGVLATVEGIPPGDVDLIAPSGIVDAGDAGIRATGAVTIAATAVLNATNIAATSTSAPTSAPAPVSAPSVGAITSAASTAGAAANQADNFANQPTNTAPVEEAPSIFVVEVVGYGGGTIDDDDRDDEEGTDL